MILMSSLRRKLYSFCCLITVTVFLTGCGGGGSGTENSESPTNANKVLIVYDAPANQPSSKLGFGYAIMLRNLLGHFNTNVNFLAVENYTANNINQYDSIFYIGSYYNNILPQQFLTDISNTTKRVVWFRYNLNQLTTNPAFQFQQKFGFNFVGIRGYNSAPTTGNSNPGFFDAVEYKSQTLNKYYAFDTATGTATSDPDLGITQIVDSTKASQVVSVKNTVTQEQAPYIIKSGNFWYFADLPLSFMGARSPYLVLCDILHDILDQQHATSHKALVRLEDVSYITRAESLKTLSDYFSSQNISFSLAVIPFYRDPLGTYSGGAAQEVHLKDAPVLRESLNYAVARGGNIVMHGYTHQYGNVRNAGSGTSGDDFEFWNIVDNRPVAEDSQSWVLARIDAGLNEFKANGYNPFAWETPHYIGSPYTAKASLQRFPKAYQRVTYFTSDTPTTLNSNGANKDFALNQFFPYVINADYYGQKIIPENLGNIEYGRSSPEDLLTNAKYALVVRDGYASFFFHPFLLNPGITQPAFSDLKGLIQGINNLGYTWADASKL